jgi:hypothetical protein
MSLVRSSGEKQVAIQMAESHSKFDDSLKKPITSLNTRSVKDVLIWPKIKKSGGAKSGLSGG